MKAVVLVMVIVEESSVNIGITDQTYEETSMCLFKRMGVSGLHKDLENGRMGFGVVCSGFGFEA